MKRCKSQNLPVTVAQIFGHSQFEWNNDAPLLLLSIFIARLFSCLFSCLATLQIIHNTIYHHSNSYWSQSNIESIFEYNSARVILSSWILLNRLSWSLPKCKKAREEMKRCKSQTLPATEAQVLGHSQFKWHDGKTRIGNALLCYFVPLCYVLVYQTSA